MIFFTPFVRKRMMWRDIYLSFLLLAVVIATLFSTTPTSAESLAMRLAGKILLQVEAKGEAWYVHPTTFERFYLGRPDDAFRVMREQGLGISNADLALIPEAGTTTTGNRALRERLSGHILLQVEAHGEAWYVNPDTTRRHYLGRPDDAFALMRTLGLGISNLDVMSIPVSADSAPSNGVASVPTSTTTALNDGKDTQRQTLLASMNVARAKHQLPAFTLQHALSTAAQAQVNDMQLQGYLDFVSPQGKGIKDFVAAAGYEAHTVAENLVQTNNSASTIVALWQEEGGVSFDNVLDAEYEHVGVGLTTIDGSTVYAVVFALSFETFFSNNATGLDNLDDVRTQMLIRVNAERASEGLPALKLNHLLNLSAQAHADDMFTRAYYAHESPEGTKVIDRVLMTGYAPVVVAENIAKNQFSVNHVMDSWMASEGHRINIMDASIQDVGFGLRYGQTVDGYAILWVQNFARPE